MMKTPRWFLIIAIIALLPAFSLPWLINSPSADDPFLKLIYYAFPIYLATSSYLAYKIFPERQTLAWILIILSILSDFSIWFLL